MAAKLKIEKGVMKFKKKIFSPGNFNAFQSEPQQ
jgi:hypothetical protein